MPYLVVFEIKKEAKFLATHSKPIIKKGQAELVPLMLVSLLVV